MKGGFPGSEVLPRTSDLAVHDSGLWQHLQTDELPVADCVSLIAATSDNLATNVLLARIGLESVTARAQGLGLTSTSLNDFVRDVRGAQHPEALSHGSAAELAGLMRQAQAARSSAAPSRNRCCAGSHSTLTCRWSPAASELIPWHMSNLIDTYLCATRLAPMTVYEPMLASSRVLVPRSVTQCWQIGNRPTPWIPFETWQWKEWRPWGRQSPRLSGNDYRVNFTARIDFRRNSA